MDGPGWLRRQARSCGLAALLVVPPGCRGQTDQVAAPRFHLYREALARTAPAAIQLLCPGADGEQAALARFREFYEVYSAERIRAGVRALYAPDAYFGDPFKSVQGLDAIERYFLKMAEPIQECTFAIDRCDGAGGEYYCTWEMHLLSRAAPRKPVRVLGISHVRFSTDGQVVFQQDYWDTGAVLDVLPVVGRLTRHVKRRLQ